MELELGLVSPSEIHGLSTIDPDGMTTQGCTWPLYSATSRPESALPHLEQFIVMREIVTDEKLKAYHNAWFAQHPL